MSAQPVARYQVEPVPDGALTVRRPPCVPQDLWDRAGWGQRQALFGRWQATLDQPGWTPEEELRGKAAYDNWLRSGKRSHVTPMEISQWRSYKRRQRDRRYAEGRMRIVNSGRAVQAAELAADGMSLNDAADYLGVNRGSLTRVLLLSEAGVVALKALRANGRP